jgi:peptide/nickel transport system substrate-binding protein
MKGLRIEFAALLITAFVFFVVWMDSSNKPSTVEVTPQPTTTIMQEAPPTATLPPTPTAQPTLDAVTMGQPQQPITVTDDFVTYREGLVGTVRRLNPLFVSTNSVDADISALIYEGLTRLDQYGDIVPLLAEKWTVSHDGYIYVFELRQDILWQDGEAFTADDVIYTLSLLQTPNDDIFSHELTQFWRTVEIEKIDDYVIRFRLAQPLASFSAMLRIGILPEHALRGTTAEQISAHPFNLSPIGTGAYQLEALRVKDNQIHQVDLLTAPNYKLRPEGQDGYAIQRMSFHIFDNLADVMEALTAREIDGYATADRAERRQVEAVRGYAMYQTLTPNIGFLLFNWANDDVPFMRDERFRIALANGLDRSPVVIRALYNQAVVADSPIPRFSWAYSYGQEALGAAWIYNPDEAVEELNILRARYVEDITQNTYNFSFTILTIDDPAMVSMANDMAAQWEYIGISVTVESVGQAEYEQRIQDGEFEAAIVEFSKAGNADPDVYGFWHDGQYENGLNYGAVNSVYISEPLELARRDHNGINRRIHYNNFQRAFINRVIAIPLYTPLYTYIVNPSVEGVQLGFIGTSADRFVTLQDWVMEKEN